MARDWAVSEWAMLGSNQRPLPCEGRYIHTAEYLYIRQVRIDDTPQRRCLAEAVGDHPLVLAVPHVALVDRTVVLMPLAAPLALRIGAWLPRLQGSY